MSRHDHHATPSSQSNALDWQPRTCPPEIRKTNIIMKTNRSHLLRLLATVITIILSCAFGGRAATDETSGNLPHAVRFELGDAQFARGDNITITQMRGTSETIATGGTYCVEGTYTLASGDEADLAFFTTTITDSGPSPIDPRQHVRLKKGTGSFRLVKTLNEDGYLHLSFYPVPSGGDFGGVYFGQGNRVFLKNQSHSDHPGKGDAPRRARNKPHENAHHKHVSLN